MYDLSLIMIKQIVIILHALECFFRMQGAKCCSIYGLLQMKFIHPFSMEDFNLSHRECEV